MRKGPVRFGILGAARIAPTALVRPADRTDDVVVAAVAARDAERGRSFAARHGIPRYASRYEDLIASDEIDAIYVALPASLHARWAKAAARSGKHVLVEKPIACNADEAAGVVKAANEAGVVLAEAMHCMYHPMLQRIQDILREGALGAIEHVDSTFTSPIPDVTDIRYRVELGGGSLMDLGCYAVQWIRLIAGDDFEPTEARAVESPRGIDVEIHAELRDHRVTATLRCGMAASLEHRAELRVRGSRGRLFAKNPMAPHEGAELHLETARETQRESFQGRPSYEHQLEAFVDAIRSGTPLPTGGLAPVANMRLIDAVYRACGMQPRGSRRERALSPAPQ